MTDNQDVPDGIEPRNEEDVLFECPECGCRVAVEEELGVAGARCIECNERMKSTRLR